MAFTRCLSTLGLVGSVVVVGEATWGVPRPSKGWRGRDLAGVSYRQQRGASSPERPLTIADRTCSAFSLLFSTISQRIGVRTWTKRRARKAGGKNEGSAELRPPPAQPRVVMSPWLLESVWRLNYGCMAMSMARGDMVHQRPIVSVSLEWAEWDRMDGADADCLRGSPCVHRTWLSMTGQVRPWQVLFNCA